MDWSQIQSWQVGEAAGPSSDTQVDACACCLSHMHASHACITISLRAHSHVRHKDVHTSVVCCCNVWLCRHRTCVVLSTGMVDTFLDTHSQSPELVAAQVGPSAGLLVGDIILDATSLRVVLLLPCSRELQCQESPAGCLMRMKLLWMGTSHPAS